MYKKESWNQKRRLFIKGLMAAGIVSQFGFFESCANSGKKIDYSFFNSIEFDNLSAVVNHLFPDNGNGPGAEAINAIPHIIWSLQDQTYGYDAYDMFTVSLKELNEFCSNSHQSQFFELNETKKNEVIESISKLKWGDRFLVNTTNYIFEALVLDPAYHVNNNEMGWKWLHHSPGYPRPEQTDLYPVFIDRIK